MVYNDAGEFSCVTDAEGKKTYLEYDAEHNLRLVTYPDGSTLRRAYDRWGRCIFEKGPSRDSVHYFYDHLDRLTRVQFSNPDYVSFSYNAYDDVVSIDSFSRAG